MSYQVTKELLERGRETPHIRKTKEELVNYRLSELDYGMTIGVEVTSNGRVYVSWVGGGDNSKAFMVVARMEENGKCGDPLLVIDPHDEKLPCDRCSIVGNLWIDPKNRLWLFFNETLGHFDGSSSDWAIVCEDPEADEIVWSEPRYIWRGETLNKPTVRRNGEWLLPVSLWARRHITPPFDDQYHELDDMRMAHVFVSTDEGATFERRGGVVFPMSAFDEHMIVERTDGSLWMLARTSNGLMESESTDGGYTWCEPRFSRIQSVSARFHLRRLLSGSLLLIKHGEILDEKPEQRSRLAAFLSDDDGRNWSEGFLLDERADISYPDMAQSADGTLYITYDRDRAGRGEILLAKLREEDIRAGAIISKDSFLSRVVARPGKAKGWKDEENLGLKARLKAGDPAFGIMLSEIYVPNIVRLLAECRYDFVLVDCEHGYFDLSQIANLCAVSNCMGFPLLVRVPSVDRGMITKMLDSGVDGILMANVESAADARALCEICYYAPEGDRGVSTFRAHMGYRRQNCKEAMERANRTKMVICQIESPEGLRELDDILNVEGVDGVLVGPNDLSQHLGVYGEYQHPLMESALNQVANAARKKGKWSGIITNNVVLSRRSAALGMRCFSGGSELSALADGASRMLEALKNSYDGGEKK